MAESDFGAGRIWKVDSKFVNEREAERNCSKPRLPLGIVPGSLEKPTDRISGR